LYAERMYGKNVVPKSTNTEVSNRNERTRALVDEPVDDHRKEHTDRSSSRNISVSTSEISKNLKKEIIEVYAHYVNSGMRRQQIRAAFQSHFLNILKDIAMNMLDEMDSDTVSRASLEATSSHLNAVNDIRQQTQQSSDTIIEQDKMKQKKSIEKNVDSDKMDNKKRQSFIETNLDNITLPVNKVGYVVNPLLSLASEKFRNENHPTAISSVCTRVDDFSGVSILSLKDGELDNRGPIPRIPLVKFPDKSIIGKSVIYPNFEKFTGRNWVWKNGDTGKVSGSSMMAPVKTENIPESSTGKNAICPNFESVTGGKPASKDKDTDKVPGSSMMSPVKTEDIPESSTGKNDICSNFENASDSEQELEDTDMDEMIDKLMNDPVDLENIPEKLRYKAIYHDLIVNVLMNKNFKRSRKPIDSKLINVPMKPMCIDHILMRCESEKAKAKEVDEIPTASLKKRRTRKKDIDFDEILDYESVVSKGSKQIQMSKKTIYDLISTNRTLPKDLDTIPESMMRTWGNSEIIDSPLTRSLRKQKKLNVDDKTREMLSDSGYASGMACESDVADVKSIKSSISDLIPPKGNQAENREGNSAGTDEYCELTVKDELPKCLNEEFMPSVSGKLKNRKIGVDDGKNTVRDSVNKQVSSFTKPETVTFVIQRRDRMLLQAVMCKESVRALLWCAILCAYFALGYWIARIIKKEVSERNTKKIILVLHTDDNFLYMPTPISLHEATVEIFISPLM
ncbi:hypothetical protein T4E_5182, partial [Trichinella pseudospiralis]